MPSGKVTWQRDMRFIGVSGSGHGVVVDTRPEQGGFGTAPSNTELLLIALCGCTGMDVVSILKKKRIDFDDFEVTAEAELAPDLPKRLTAIELVYRIWGGAVKPQALEQAVELSQSKYCTISNTVKGVARISHRCEIDPPR